MEHKYPKSFNDLIKPIKFELFIVVLLSIIGSISQFIAPIAVTVSISKYLAGDADQFLIWIIIAAVGLVLKQILHMISLGYAHIVEANFRYTLRKDFSEKLSRLPLGFFSETSSGAIRKLVSENTIKIHTIVAHVFSEAAAGITLPVSCIVIMLVMEWHTALIILGFAFLILFIGMFWMSFSSRGMEDINSRYEKSQREMSHSAIEMVDGIKEIKNFGISGTLFKRFDVALQAFSNVSFEWLGTSSKAISFVMAAIQPTIMLLVSLLVCMYSIDKGWLQPEYSLLFMLLSIALPSTLIAVMQLGNFIRDGKHAVNTLLNLYENSDQVFKEKPSDFVNGDILFENVNFAYDGENYVLRNINCNIEKNGLTAFVGASGSGKTTMARLISRFWDVSEGRVTIGGIDVRDLSEKDMLSNISLVFQDIALMNASIFDNISLSKDGATREEVERAAKAACIHDRIMQLPNGYDSIYGDEGVVLSGGEKQRITIARALLADTPIVLLDEATAQADAESEVEIQKALSALRSNKTVVMIAHRLSSIVNADKIVVFEKGSVVQEGTHDVLITLNGLYRDMWLSQNSEGGDR